jgi:hypothetical protein
VDGSEAPLLRVNHTQIGIHLRSPSTFHVRVAYEPPYRRLADVLAAPARLIAGAQRAEPSNRQLSVDDLPRVCASPNAQD